MSRVFSIRNLVIFFTAVPILGFAVVVAYRPELLPPSVRLQLDQLTGGVEVRMIILVAGGILICIGVLGSWTWRTTDATSVLSEMSPEAPDREVTITGAALTTEFERNQKGYYTESSLEASLRAALVDLYSHELDSDRAESFVDSGEWTEDRVAAATLTATDAVDFPLIYRLYAWLYPDHAYSYRIRRTLRVVENTCSAELTAYTPPERSQGRLGRLQAWFDSGSGGDQ